MPRLPAFTYRRPATVAEVLTAMAAGGAAALLAGGAGLVSDMKCGKIAPRLLIDLKGIPELGHIEGTGHDVHLGPLVTLHTLTVSPLVRQHCPLLAEAAAAVGSPQLRHQATLGGNLCSHTPPSDLLPALAALGAEIELVSRTGNRVVAAANFAAGPAAGELITGVRLAVPAAAGWGFCKFSERAAFDGALATAAALAHMTGGRLRQVTLVAGALGPRVQRLHRTAAVLQELAAHGTPPPAAVAALAAAAATEVEVAADLRASAAYRRHLGGVLVARVAAAALSRALATSHPA